jgi:hypothetical protein
MWIPQDPRLEPLRKVPLAGNLDEGQAIIREFVAQSPDDPYLCLWWAYGSLLVSMFEEAMELSERAAAIFRRRLIGRKRLPVWATRRAIEIERGRYESLTLQMKRGEPMTFRRVGMWERMNNAYYIPHDMRHSLRLVQVDAEGIRLARWPMGRVHRITWSNVSPRGSTCRKTVLRSGSAGQGSFGAPWLYVPRTGAGRSTRRGLVPNSATRNSLRLR